MPLVPRTFNPLGKDPYTYGETGPQWNYFTYGQGPATPANPTTPPAGGTPSGNPLIDAFQSGVGANTAHTTEGGAGTGAAGPSGDPGPSDIDGLMNSGLNLATFAGGPLTALLGTGYSMASGKNPQNLGLGNLFGNPLGLGQGPVRDRATAAYEEAFGPNARSSGSQSMDFFSAINNMDLVGRLGGVLDAQDMDRQGTANFGIDYSSNPNSFAGSNNPEIAGRGYGDAPSAAGDNSGETGPSGNTSDGGTTSGDGSPDPMGGPWAKGGHVNWLKRENRVRDRSQLLYDRKNVRNYNDGGRIYGNDEDPNPEKGGFLTRLMGGKSRHELRKERARKVAKETNAQPSFPGRGDGPGYAEGKRVRGPGDGQSDSIPAMLSNGEYVIDADTVSMIGDGSNDAGADKLDVMRKQVRKKKTGTTKQPRRAKFNPNSLANMLERA